jgi:hypothetical protein
LYKSWTDSLFPRLLRLRQKQHLQHSKKHQINSTIEEDEAAEEIEGAVEDVVHSEVEAVHRRAAVEQTSNIKTPIILDMDKILETINQIMAISSNNILSNTKIISNMRLRSITKLLNNISLHRDHMSILRLETCKLKFILNLKPILNPKCRNTGSKPDLALDKTVNHYTRTNLMPTHRLENVHATKLSETQTGDIP